MSIRIENLTKRYGENLVVSNVSLEVADSELFVLLGGSGSGKTTVLRMIAGLIVPDDGRVTLNGRDVTHLPPQARNTGFVFQNYSVFRHMTVAENVRFGLKIRKVTSREQQQRSAELLEMVGLTGYGDRFPNQLSGGQLQRVALARALAYDPAVLLLDEPFSALDVKIRGQLRQNLREIQRALKVTMVLVTHDQEEAFELADRIGVMDRAQLVEVGTPDQLYHRPRTEFAATFIGGGNVLVGREEGGAIRLGQVRLPFPENTPVFEAGAPVRILFRPETVLLQDQPFKKDAKVIQLGKAEVVERTFAGSTQRVLLSVDGLRGSRPLKPFLRFGSSRTMVRCDLLSESTGKSLEPGQEMWLGLSNFHVLQPSGLKVLIHAAELPVSEALLDYSSLFVKSCAGSAALFRAAASDETIERDLLNLQEIKRKYFSEFLQVDTRIGQGDETGAIISEALQGDYEVVVLPHSTGVLGGTAFHLCRDLGLPVLLVPQKRPDIQRILICTAGGEPGKSDIQFGGRIARRARAEVTLFHVRSMDVPPEVKVRTGQHLDQGKDLLSALGVSAEVKVKGATPVVSGVLHEAAEGDYDLVVIGAPAPRAEQRMYWSDLATPIAQSIERPLLIVPARP